MTIRTPGRCHAVALGGTGEQNLVRRLVEEPGAERQRRLAGDDDDQRRPVAMLAEDFTLYQTTASV